MDNSVSSNFEEPAWVKDLRSQVMQISEKEVTTWCGIVLKTGLNKPLLEQWTNIFITQMKELYKEMIDEARENQGILVTKIEAQLEKCETLRRELRLKMPEYGDQGLNLFEEHQLLTKRIEEYEKILDDKKKEIISLLEQQKASCRTLSWPVKDIPLSPLPSDVVVEDLRKYIDQMDSIKFERLEIFLTQKTEILKISSELKYKPSLDFEKTVLNGEDSDFCVTDENMSKLHKFYKYLKGLYDTTCNDINEAREKIQELWLILSIEPDFCQQFLKKNTGKSLDTLNALNEEIKRCKALKVANIQVIVKRLREELVKLWDKCHIPEAERSLFEYFNCDIYTEDLLTLYDFEIEKVKRYYNTNSEIFTMLEKRKNLWSQMLIIEDKAYSKDRLKNRGGQLLKEEKERNMVLKQIPKMEEKLLSLANEYEERTGNPFLTWGETIGLVISRNHDEYEQNKKLKLSEIKQVREKTITPGKSTLSLMRCTSTQSLAKLGGSSVKRKLLTPSCSSKKPRNILTSSNLNKVPQTAPPKIAPRYSTEKSKREARRRRMSQRVGKIQKENLPYLDYSSFEKELCSKDECRSTLFHTEPPLAMLLPITPNSPAPIKRNIIEQSPRNRPKLATAPSLQLLF